MKNLIALFAVVLLCSTFTNAQDSKNPNVKLGIVDIETVVKEMPEAIKADQDLKELGGRYQDTLIKMQQDFEEKISSYQKQKGMMAADQQQQTEEDLQRKQMELMQYKELKFGQNGELNKLRMDKLEPIRAKILSTIKEIAKKENMSFVFDKNGPTLLFAEDKFDITFSVIDRLKRGN